MPSSAPPDSRRLDIRKYANRRFYDATHSKPVTQEEIHHFIRNGHAVRVTDAKTGDDITVRVLAQIILDMDGPKLAVFPVELLHRLIQSNEKLMHDFVDKYFNQALMLFLESRRKFDDQLRSAIGLGMTPSQTPDWARMMGGQFLPPFWMNPAQQPKGAAGGAAAAGDQTQETERTVQELQQQIQSLKQELANRDDKARKKSTKRRRQPQRK
jgi:polyhydroxyalkanoate synthesis repressor PhaR